MPTTEPVRHRNRLRRQPAAGGACRWVGRTAAPLEAEPDCPPFLL